MFKRRVTSFVEALVRNRRPDAFRAGPGDREAMRAAIELRTARTEETAPSPEFVEDLHAQLRRQLDGDREHHPELGEVRPVEMPRISRRKVT